MAKAAKTKPTTRKAQAKKANAPMKNTPKEKSPATKAKADAKKAARTMAKTVKPGIRKSAAKRVEKTEKKAALSAAALKRIGDIKVKASGLISLHQAGCSGRCQGRDGLHAGQKDASGHEGNGG